MQVFFKIFRESFHIRFRENSAAVGYDRIQMIVEHIEKDSKPRLRRNGGQMIQICQAATRKLFS